MNHNLVGIFGGTFDPIHYGHLNLAQELLQQLPLDEIRFIPCQIPVFDKTAQASPQQRLAMLQLALSEHTKFVIDERELNRLTPSYTVDTLLSLRNEINKASLCLIIGTDTLNDLTRWHRWHELIQLAHFIIVLRPDYPLPQSGEVADLIQQHQINDAQLLKQKSAGYIYIANTKPSTISATEIRHKIAADINIENLLPNNVLKFIKQENLYQS